MTAVSRARDRRIFVQIPAYRDGELGSTLRSLYARASNPQNLRTVVLWQKDPKDRLPADVYELPNLTIVETPASDSQGPNWARRMLQAHLEDEPYVLTLDSHHRFVSGWDELVLGMHDQLIAGGVKRPLLTSYLPAYIPHAGKSTRLSDPYRIYPLEREDGVLTRLTSYPIYGWRELDAPTSGDWISLHFLFAAREFVTTVPSDSDVYFFGDEVALSLRAFTHGWDIYHPHRVIGWHAYDRGTREPHWNRHDDWRRTHTLSLRHLRELYTGASSASELLGNERTIGDFEEFTMQKLVLS